MMTVKAAQSDNEVYHFWVSTKNEYCKRIRNTIPDNSLFTTLWNMFLFIDHIRKSRIAGALT